mgnify:CR=1 FL=1
MRRNTFRKWVAYIVSAALTMTLGISWLTTDANHTNANTSFTFHSPVWPIGQNSPFVLPAAEKLHAAEAAGNADSEPETAAAGEAQADPRELTFEYETIASLDRFQSAAVAATTGDIAKNPDKEVHIAVSRAPQTQIYEVTAYFLNVRTNAYSKSKIKSVVQKGTRLEIVSETPGGWLRIKGGGYVHGDYAQPVEDAGAVAAAAMLWTALPDTEPNAPEAEPKAEEPKAEDAKREQPKAEEPSKAPVQPSSKVETESGLTEEDIALIFKGTDLAGHGLEEAILEVEETYGINALFTIAVMKLESGNGSSRLAKNKNNLFGLNATGPDPHRKAFAFETKGDSVKKFGQLLADKYVDKGYTTIEKIATKYCPANSKWPSLVKNIMKKDYKKLNVI